MAFNLDAEGKPIPSFIPPGAKIVDVKPEIDAVGYTLPGSTQVITRQGTDDSGISSVAWLQKAQEEFAAGGTPLNKADSTSLNIQADITPGAKVEGDKLFYGTPPAAPIAESKEPLNIIPRSEAGELSGRNSSRQTSTKTSAKSSTQKTQNTSSQSSSSGIPQFDSLKKSVDTLQRAKNAGMQITPKTSVQEAQRFLGEEERNFVEEEKSQKTTAFAGTQAKFGLPQTENDFFSDPIKTIKDITTQIFQSMGMGEADAEIKSIANELEGLENKRDEEIRNINDDPWLTEGVRLRKIAKAEEKWADQINNRVNKLQLLESVKDDARQQAQFALSTAIGIWDSERRFQQDQIQMYYDQAQREFDNAMKLQAANAPEKGTSDMQEYLFAVENSQFSGSFLDWKSSVAGATRAPTGGGGGVGGVGTITDASGEPLKLAASQTDTISGYNNTVSSAQTALSLLNAGVKTGPVEGTLLQGAKLVGKADPNQLRLEQTLGKLKADFMKALSGAAVSDQEVIRLSKFLPDIYDQEDVIKSKLSTLIAETNQSKTNYLRTLGGQEVGSSGGGDYDSYLRSIGE